MRGGPQSCAARHVAIAWMWPADAEAAIFVQAETINAGHLAPNEPVRVESTALATFFAPYATTTRTCTCAGNPEPATVTGAFARTTRRGAELDAAAAPASTSATAR